MRSVPTSATTPRVRRLSERLLFVLVLAALALGSTVPALAQDEEGESVRGTLRDGEGEPVEGAVITVTDDAGQPVGEAATDAEGQWEVSVPGPGNYEAALDTETLPEGVGLRDPDRDVLDLTIRTGQQRTVVFQLGEEESAVAIVLPRLIQNTVNGIKFGLIIAMTAVGLSLIFGTTGLINFAHGDLVTFGAVAAFFLNAAGPGIQLIPAALIAVALGGLVGAGLERGLWHPLRARKTGLIQMLVISIGLAFVLRYVILIFFGGRSRPYLDYAVQSSMTFGPVRITPRDLTVVVLSVLILVGVAVMLEQTRLGKAMRAVSDNRDLAESSGIDVQRIILFVWILGAGLAALGGIFLGAVENVSYLMGFRLLLLMFAGVILGGLGTAYGVMVGSLVVGIVTEVSTIWFSAELKFVWALAVLIVVLLVRPQGILGIKERVG